jgi:predicted DNA-binding protein (MmcQ/YjbR family)
MAKAKTTTKTKASPTLAKVRAICLGLPTTSEGLHFGDISFKAGKKMFATCSADGSELIVQLEPDHLDALVESDPRITRYPRAKNCAVVPLSAKSNWQQIRDLIEESYRLITSKPKRR